jgi:hypothetical protein
MNYRRGGLRLLTVIAAAWCLLWGANYYFAGQALDRHLQAADRLSAQISETENRTLGPAEAAREMERRRQFDEELDRGMAEAARRDHSLWMGLGGLGVILALATIGAWVVRGFTAP